MPDNIIKHTVVVNQNSSFASNLMDIDFRHQQFTDFSGHNKEITRCNFSYAFFQRAYFRKVRFIECDFTGAKFFDSNLRDAEFIKCKFPYSIFKFTLIRSREVIQNLPEWPNVRITLLQNHKANANSLGDSKSSRLYLFLEIESSKEHLRRARKKEDGYYTSKYKGWRSSIDIYWKSFIIYLDDILWGHGESPWKIARNVIILIALFSFFQTLSIASAENFPLKQCVAKFLNYMWEDLKTFVGVTAKEVSDFTKVLLILFRYLTIGLFIRILFNKYSWR
jgi:hypothetical protein